MGCLIFIDRWVSKPSGLVINGNDASKYEPWIGNSVWSWWSFYELKKKWIYFQRENKNEPF